MSTYAMDRPTKYCQTCGVIIDAGAVVCPKCGVMQPMPVGYVESEKRILPAFLLSFFLGWAGAHRFYTGKIWTGLLQLVTAGGFGVWWIIDMIMIACGAFRDSDGHKITEWT